VSVAGWLLAVLGWGASLWLIAYEIRSRRYSGQGAPRRVPELHVPAGLVAGLGVGLLWGWAWGLGAGLAQAVGLFLLALRIRS
jgi:hypothetical protein